MRFLAFLWLGVSALAYGLVHFPGITASIVAGLFAGWVLYNIALEIKAQIANHKRRKAFQSTEETDEEA